MSAAPAAREVRFGYNPGLDGLRAIAIVAVICLHGGYAPSGGIQGVTMFFVVSGYLITSLLESEFARHGTIRFGHFYRRRLVRLFPALLVVTIAGAAYLLYIQTPISTWWAGAVGSVTYTTDLISGFFGNQAVSSNFQFTWTLGIEEQFYLLWPIILLLSLRLGRIIPAMVFVALGVILTWVYRATQDSNSPDPAVSAAYQFGPLSHLDALLLGCGIALILVRFPNSAVVRRIAVVLGVIGSLTLGVYLFLNQSPFTNDGYGFLAIVSACVVLWVAASPNGPLSRALAFRPFVFIGRISYGIYLWNIVLLWAFVKIFNFMPGTSPLGLIWVAAVFGFAWASYRFVETPFRRRWAAPQPHAVVAEVVQEPATSPVERGAVGAPGAVRATRRD